MGSNARLAISPQLDVSNQLGIASSIQNDCCYNKKLRMLVGVENIDVEFANVNA